MKSKKKEQGQITVMLGMMIMTFLFFFCFVVNIGMLVNAKINLQNAADLAAYAGAAVQARQLNTISYLNYEMRRQYKKFLFRYYIVGTMSYASTPTTVAQQGGATARQWNPAAGANCTKGAANCVNYQVPMVCIIYNPDDNFCHNELQPGIVAPTPSSFDAINQALGVALGQIEESRQKNCNAIALSNELVLLLWLWNTDPTTQSFATQIQSALASGNQNAGNAANTASVTNMIKVISGLTQGLGLIPRELVLRERIKTMEGYVNVGNQSVTEDLALQLRSSKDPSQYERSIQAFFSAYLSLGNHTFWDPTQITMDELMPPGGPDNGDNLLNLKDVTTTFDAWSESNTLTATNITSSAGINLDSYGNNPSTTPKNCVPIASLQKIAAATGLGNGAATGLSVGVYKDPTVLTYYAIRLQAQAHVLFNPFGGSIQLTAYSAARPFGSRIGPRLTSSNFIWTDIEPSTAIGGSGQVDATLPYKQIPNLAITLNEGNGQGAGWDTVEAEGTYFGTAFPGIANDAAGGGSNPVISSDQLEQAYQVAMAPNPEEEGYYNIPTANSSNFGPTFDGSDNLVLWAPVAPPSNPGTVTGDLTNALRGMITGTDATTQDFANAAVAQLETYISSGLGENGETMNTVTLNDPFDSLATAASPGTSALGLPEWIMPIPTPGKDLKSILTSWNHPNDATYRTQEATQGRSGYSVKFVPFTALTENGGTTASDLGEPITNLLINDDINADLGSEMGH